MSSRYTVYGTSEASPINGPPKDIFEAAERGNAKWIQNQVDRTVEFEISQRDGLARTALHWASETGQYEVAEVLMDYGIDVLATECNGRTAVHLACRAADSKMLEIILSNLEIGLQETLVNQTDNNGITPVYLAMQKGEEGRAALEILINSGARYYDLGAKKTPAAQDDTVTEPVKP